MGNKAFKWFRSLLGSKKSAPRDSHAPPWKDKKNGDDPLASPYVAQGLDANKHAIAVAAATAAVAEAALAAAQAAAEVVRLTSGGGGRVVERRRVEAAVRIQAAFRAYLARRALRALKALVKLQALVRGHIVRKQSADMLRRMQAMARIQARASACRSYTTNPSLHTHVRSSKSLNLGTVNPKTYDNPLQNSKHGGYKSTLKQYNSRQHTGNITKNEKSQLASNWLDHWMQQTRNNDTLLQTNLITEDQRSDKILEIDTWKPRQNAKKDSSPSSSHVASQYFSAWNDMGHEHSRISDKTQKPNPSVSSEEVSSVIIPPEEADQVAYWTAENSPRIRSASSRQTSNNSRAPFTPARSEYSRSVYGDYISHPSYMANTESSRAKVRSQSAPKQRLRLEELGVSLNSDRGFWDSDTYSEKGFALPGHYKNSNANVNSGYVRKQGTSTRRGGFSPTKR